MNEPDARAYQDIASTDQGQMRLSELAAMFDRAQQLRVETCDAGQILSIDAIVLVLILVDQTQLPRVGDDHLMSQSVQQAAHPR